MNEVDACLNELIRPIKVSEFLALAETGAFDNERVELIRGRVIRVPQMSEAHAWAIQILNNLLVEQFGKWAHVRPSLPLNAADDSLAMPDFALVPKTKAPGDAPTKAFLLIEVSNTSLRFDLIVKAPLYAEGGSPEYWIVNIPEAKLEVFRKPEQGRWTERFALSADDTIRPVAFPDVEFSLRDFLVASTH